MKLIDEDKLQDWIDRTEFAFYGRYGETGDGVVKALGMLKERLDAGYFDPTPPVQPDTLSKLYKCPNCERVNIAEAWNYATAAKYGATEITRIDETGCMDASYVCPSCGTEEDYGRLEVIK